MTIDIDGLSAKELQALMTKAAKRKKALAKRKPLAQVKKELALVAKKAGYTLAEIFGGGTAKSEPKAKAPRKAMGKRGKVAPKYRNPANASETWSGRGKPPRWMAAEIATGKTPQDFLI